MLYRYLTALKGAEGFAGLLPEQQCLRGHRLSLLLKQTTMCVQSEAAMQVCFRGTWFCILLSAIQSDIAAFLDAQALSSVLDGLCNSESILGLLADPSLCLEVAHAYKYYLLGQNIILRFWLSAA